MPACDRSIARAAFLVALGLLAACGRGGDPARSAGTELQALVLGQPTLEIGTIDGPEPFAFAALETVLRLPNGRVAVSDAGATAIAIFEASGEHVVSWGRSGDGPGEFNNLSRLYPLGQDSLMAAERFSGRLAVFDLDGQFSRVVPGEEFSSDSIFVLDSWLHRRFWVDGALTAEARRDTRTVLDRLPLPDEAPGYRSVSVGDDGTLWIMEPDQVDGAHLWTRVDSNGAPTAVLSIPARFTPTHFRADEVLGVWTGEADVHFVRAYSFGRDAAASRSPEAWLKDQGTTPVLAESVPQIDQVVTAIQNSIRQMASAQEIHYATHMTYTDDIDSLDAFETPSELWIDFIKGDARGWAGVFVHPRLDRVCGLAYGYGIPAGWTPGAIVCAPGTDGPQTSN